MTKKGLPEVIVRALKKEDAIDEQSGVMVCTNYREA